MKTNHKLTLAVLAGVLIGVAGATAIHAQQAKAAPFYVIAEVEVTDPTTLKKYGEKAPQIVADFNGHYVVRGGKTQALEGEQPKGLHRGNWFRQRGESARMIRFAGLCGHQAIPAKLNADDESIRVHGSSLRNGRTMELHRRPRVWKRSHKNQAYKA